MGGRVSRRALLGGIAGGALAVAGGGAWLASRFAGPARLRWRKPLAAQVQELHPAGDTLLVTGAGLTAYAARDGAVRWRQDGGDDIQPGRFGTAPFTADADAFAVRAEDAGSARIRVSGLGDGAERWQRSFEGYLGSTLLTAAGTVVAAADQSGGRGLGAYDGSGERWWHGVQAADDGPFDLAAADGTLLVAARELAAFDLADGTKRWGVAGADGRVFGRPALHGDLAVALAIRFIDDDFGYRNLAVHALNPKTGDVRWVYEAPGGFLADGPPPVIGPTVLAVHEDGLVTGLDAATGRERWSADESPTDLAAFGDRVYLAVSEGVIGLDPRTGAPADRIGERDPYRLAGAGRLLAVAAGDSLALYDIG